MRNPGSIMVLLLAALLLPAGVSRAQGDLSWFEWVRISPIVVAGENIGENGRNVVLHEFAHQLDMIGGVVDGTPPLRAREDYPEWQRVMTDEYEALRDASNLGQRTLLNPYGATNPAEFFAVTTECFFERPGAMRSIHPELYRVLARYYGQDPAEREETWR